MKVSSLSFFLDSDDRGGHSFAWSSTVMHLKDLPAFVVRCGNLKEFARAVAVSLDFEDIEKWRKLRVILGDGDPFVEKFNEAIEREIEK